MKWWVVELASEEDPISLEPLRKLRYPPFQCRADLSLPHRTASDWFDGRVLAHYLVATANFQHPISRRELGREECVDLDQYCVEHHLGGAHVTQVFDGAKAGEAGLVQLRAEAEVVLQSIFGGADRRGHQPPRQAAVESEGGLTVVDDDALRLERGCGDGDGGGTAPGSSDFPSLSTLGVVPPVAAGECWADGTGRHMLPPPPPRSLTDHAEQSERERLARERLKQQRRAWAAAWATAAEARTATAAAAEAAAKSAAEAVERERWQAWEEAARREAELTAATAAAASAAAQREAEERGKALHRAAAAGDAGRVCVLLEEGHDPTLMHAEFGSRVAYEVAQTAETRDAFRGELIRLDPGSSQHPRSGM